jgi:hypothetical protein
MSRLFTSLAGPGLLLLLACDDATAPEAAASAHARPEVTVDARRPAGGECITTFVPSDFTYPLLTVRIDGVCHLRHLGRATMQATQIINVTDGLFSNTTTYVAADGDKLRTTFAGVPTSALGSPDVTFRGEEHFVGGTGRFSEASGRTVAEGSATVEPDQSGGGAYRMKGWITY